MSILPQKIRRQPLIDQLYFRCPAAGGAGPLRRPFLRPESFRRSSALGTPEGRIDTFYASQKYMLDAQNIHTFICRVLLESTAAFDLR